MPAAQRGWLPLGRVMLETRFPLGIFRAWSYVEPDARCLVYPQPERSPLPAPLAEAAARRDALAEPGQRRLLRPARPTSSPIRRATWPGRRWRAAKTCSPSSSPAKPPRELWLDWQLLPPSLGVEQRLSRLAGWVLAAERAGAHYGLRLPGVEIAPGRGEAHHAGCLQALALYEVEMKSARRIRCRRRCAGSRCATWPGSPRSLARGDRAARDCARRGG